MVYFWDLFPVNRRPEHFAGSIPISAGAGPSDGSRVFIATQDRLVKELDFSSHETTKLTAKGSAMASAAAALGSSSAGLEGAVSVAHSVETMGYLCSVMMYDEARRLLVLGTCNDDQPGAIVTTSVAGQLGHALDVNPIHSGVITAMCQSRDGNMIISGDSNGCICLSEFETAAFNKATVKEGMVSFEFVDEVLIHRSDLEGRKGQIHALTLKVEELNQNNDHQLRLKDIEHSDNKAEIEDRYNFMLEAERVKFEELDREKQSIEVAFAQKVKTLEKHQADELKTIEFKYKTKQNAEENRHRILQEETEGKLTVITIVAVAGACLTVLWRFMLISILSFTLCVLNNRRAQAVERGEPRLGGEPPEVPAGADRGVRREAAGGAAQAEAAIPGEGRAQGECAGECGSGCLK